MDKTKKMYDAYMTLEASFIMPLAVFLIAALMYLSFYLYTVSFLNQTAYVSAFRGSLCEPDSGRMKATAESELEKLLEERVLPVRNLEKQVRASPLGSERIPESGAFTSLSGGTVIYRGRLGDKGGEKSPEQGCRCFYPPGKKGRQFMID